MNDQHRFAEREGAVRRYDYETETVLAADLGVGTDATVDVVDGTAIIVTDDRQYELDIPEGDAQGFIKNGIVTIEVEQ